MNTITWILCSPLVSALMLLLLAHLKGKREKENHQPDSTALRVAVGSLASLGIFSSCMGIIVLTVQLASQHSSSALHAIYGSWFEISLFGIWESIPISFFADELTIVMLSFVGSIAFLIHIYSITYMSHEQGSVRYFASLNLFVFFMFVLVLAKNLLVVFVGWEGVGLCSYLLIGHIFQKREAGKSAMKAFVMNRIGDVGFLLAILILLDSIGTVDLQAIQQSVSSVADGSGTSGGSGDGTGTPVPAPVPAPVLSQAQALWIALFLLLGASGKSAQFPLWTWLPSAMTGPTPVSALIHAATMVTAGVYLVIRLQDLFFHHALMVDILLGIGGLTMLMGSIGALMRTNLKEILAYSTVSQLGFLFATIGLSAGAESLAHLYSHSFFKALLFLSAGFFIYQLGGASQQQNLFFLRRQVGDKAHFPQHWFLLVGCLALAGGFPMNGYFSKAAILEAAREKSVWHWLVFEFLSILTIFYAVRLYVILFWNNVSWRVKGILGAKSVWCMTMPLLLLSIFTFVPTAEFIIQNIEGAASFQGTAVIEGVAKDVYTNSATAAWNLSSWIPALEGWAISMFFLIVAILYYKRKLAQFAHDATHDATHDAVEAVAANSNSNSAIPVHTIWLDQIYERILIRPLLWLAQRLLLDGMDRSILWCVQAPARLAENMGRGITRLQGRVYAGLVNRLIAMILVAMLFFLTWAFVLEWSP